VAGRARSLGLSVGIAFNPGTSPDEAAAFAQAAGAEVVLCMSIEPGYSGQPFMPESVPRIERVAGLVSCPIQVDGGIGEDNARLVRLAGARLLVAGSAIFGHANPGAAYGRVLTAATSAT
jgi:ribulose-phosphate 3-epimerase